LQNYTITFFVSTLRYNYNLFIIWNDNESTISRKRETRNNLRLVNVMSHSSFALDRSRISRFQLFVLHLAIMIRLPRRSWTLSPTLSP